MDILERKQYPSQYPKEAVKVLDTMAFDKSNIMIGGSASLKSQQYAGDYDASEKVDAPLPSLVKGFQTIIRNLKKYYIGDIKCGVYNDKVRWTPDEVLKGFQIIQGHRFTLEEGFQSGRTKVDVIAKVKGRYTDFSMIYYFSVNGKPLNEEPKDPIKAIKDDIKLLQKQGETFKVLKRQFSLAKINNNTKELKRLSDIFNSDRGKLYKLLSDVRTLGDLLEGHTVPAKVAKQATKHLRAIGATLTTSQPILSALQEAHQSKNPLPILRGTEELLSREVNMG